ncbi:hypothetical protein GCM10022382_32430 [Microbacterium invictum]
MRRQGGWAATFAAVLVLTGCGGEAIEEPHAGDAPVSQSDAPVIIEWSASGAALTQEGVDPDQVAGLVVPAPLGTVFEFMGWQGIVTEAEVSTQPNEGDSSNPVSVVLQMTLDVSAPSPLTEQTISPFFPTPTWKTLDMPRCHAADPPQDPWTAGERREMSTCHFFHTEAIGADLPEGHITIRYGSSRYVTAVTTVTTRGPDY